MTSTIQFGIPSLDELIGSAMPTLFTPAQLPDLDLLREAKIYAKLAPRAFPRSGKLNRTAPDWRQVVCDELNELIRGAPLHRRFRHAFAKQVLQEPSWRALDRAESSEDWPRANRLLLEEAFNPLLGDSGNELSYYGIHLTEGLGVNTRASSTSLCMLGPDGTGKSVLALHLASRYAADFGPLPRVLYASTDLSAEKAGDIWNNFGLQFPNHRVVPFLGERPKGWSAADRQVKLREFAPLPTSNDEARQSKPQAPLAAYLSSGSTVASTPGEAEVAFINLAADTAGDDWGFLNRLLATLETPREGEPRHLLIIDAVEGLEALVGDRDMFGQPRSRRSRVAQILRTAAGKCHVVLTIEEPRDGERMPEEFVTDVVLRLRRNAVREYVRPTVEVVKTRGQAHVRGEHTLLIRSGAGSVTGGQENPDDPREVQKSGAGMQSYVHVLHSLHSKTRKSMRLERRSVRLETDLWLQLLGAHDISELLHRFEAREHPLIADLVAAADAGDSADSPELEETVESNEPIGPPLVPRKLARSLLHAAKEGDATVRLLRHLRRAGAHLLEQAQPPSDLTRRLRRSIKTPARTPGLEEQRLINWQLLQEAYVSNPRFAGFGIIHLDYLLAGGDKGEELLPGLPAGSTTALIGDDGTHKSRLGRAFLSGCFADQAMPGVAVLLTTHDLDSNMLAERCRMHLTHPMRLHNNRTPRLERLQERIVCRRLEAHDYSSASLFHVIQSAVEQAKYILAQDVASGLDRDRWVWGRHCPRRELIRVVIDDWSTIRAMYREVGEDPLFLPAILHFLEREGVTTLFIDTQSGGPTRIIQDETDRELRALVQHHLYTWNVLFFGETRVAISAIPPVSDGVPILIRELKPAHESGNECLTVDPHFELYSGLESQHPQPISLAVRLHAETDLEAQYADEMSRLFCQLFPAASGEAVVTCETVESYERLRDFCYLHSDTRLEYSVVFQVDEFWSPDRSRMQAQRHYLAGDTEDLSNDAFRVFQAAGPRQPKARRYQFFNPIGFKLEKKNKNGEAHVPEWDRIPYVWDFGLLLCREAAWQRSAMEKLTAHFDTTAVGDVWNALTKPPYRTTSALQPGASMASQASPQPGSDMSQSSPARTAPRWRELLEASAIVARRQSQITQETPVYSFDITMGAAQSFACLILEMWASEINKPEVFRGRRDANPGPGLRELILEFQKELYLVWLLLEEVIAPPQFTANGYEFVSRPAHRSAITARHWYATASAQTKDWLPHDAYIPVGLPGSYAVRGDWFLGVAGGSRSPRLAAQALDLFSSRRGNIHRLQAGIGLPTRNISGGRSPREHAEPQAENQQVQAVHCYYRELRTALAVPDRGLRRNVTYLELLNLGAYTEHEQAGRSGFSWIWRSTIMGYDQQARMWQRWLCRILAEWGRWRSGDEGAGAPGCGFAVYDGIVFSGKVPPPNSYKIFKDQSEFFVQALDAASWSGTAPKT